MAVIPHMPKATFVAAIRRLDVPTSRGVLDPWSIRMELETEVRGGNEEADRDEVESLWEFLVDIGDIGPRLPLLRVTVECLEPPADATMQMDAVPSPGRDPQQA